MDFRLDFLVKNVSTPRGGGCIIDKTKGVVDTKSNLFPTHTLNLEEYEVTPSKNQYLFIKGFRMLNSVLKNAIIHPSYNKLKDCRFKFIGRVKNYIENLNITNFNRFKIESIW